jgi:2-polyprenyl-3-methyl-5-hydroxy-6-metoxy-1,4-benzoquinol methylase
MEHVPCNLCGADDTVVRYPSTIGADTAGSSWSAFSCTYSGYGRHHTVVQCRQCGLVYTNPRPAYEDLLDNYEAVEDPLYIKEQEGRVLTFERHLKPVEQITGAANNQPLLDVGCYTGVFVETAARHNWEAWGLEPSHWAVAQAKARGLRVVQGTLRTADLPEDYFEVVSMWDVIEHLTDPCDSLSQAWRLLAPGGLIVVHTIDIESPFARLMGSRWPWLMEMHVYYPSRRTLRAMLERSGFQVLGCESQGRYLRLGYLMNRLSALMPAVGRPAEWLVHKLDLHGLPLSVNLGDLVTAYARKPESSA